MVWQQLGVDQFGALQSPNRGRLELEESGSCRKNAYSALGAHLKHEIYRTIGTCCFVLGGNVEVALRAARPASVAGRLAPSSSSHKQHCRARNSRNDFPHALLLLRFQTKNDLPNVTPLNVDRADFKKSKLGSLPHPYSQLI